MGDDPSDNVRPLRPILKAVEGSRRDLLLALRDNAVRVMESDPRCTPADSAAIRAEVQHIEAELAELDANGGKPAPVEPLPGDIERVIAYIGSSSKLSGGLGSTEVAMLKADMMNMSKRWRSDRVSIGAVRIACLVAGLSAVDTDRVADLLGKVHDGKRLVPRPEYRTFRFAYDFE